MPPETTARVVLVRGSLDQIDADLSVEAWIQEVAPRLGVGAHLERFGLSIPGPGRETRYPDGAVVNLWGNSGLFGQATIVRTPLNRSIVTIVEF